MIDRGEGERRGGETLATRLRQITKAINGILDLEPLLQRFVVAVGEVLDADSVWLLYPCDPNAGFIEVREAWARGGGDAAAYAVGPPRVAVGDRLPIEAAMRPHYRRVLTQMEPQEITPGDAGSILAERFAVRAMLAAAVRVTHSKPWFLSLNRAAPRRPWDDEDKELLALVAERLGGILSVAGLRREIAAQEVRYARAVTFGSSAVWEIFPEERRFVSDTGLYRLIGADPRKPIDRVDAWLDRVHAEDRARVETALARVIAGESDDYAVEHRVIRDDGAIAWLRASAEMVDDPGQGAPRLVGLLVDITGERRAQQELRELSDENRRLATESMALLDHERARISADLHDELGQLLIGIRLANDWIRRNRNRVDTERAIAECSDEIASLVDESFQSIRRIAKNLRPEVLDQLGLVDALRDSVLRWNNRVDDPVVTLSVDDDFADLAKDTAHHLYHVVLEAVTNVHRHAAASRISIGLRRVTVGGVRRLRRDELRDGGGWVRLTVEDNGVGLPLEGYRAGNGLAGMRERVSAMGGEFNLNGAPGLGTHLTVTVPIAGPAIAAAE